VVLPLCVTKIESIGGFLFFLFLGIPHIKVIVAIRFTAVSTVEKYRKNIIVKLGVSGKGELLRYDLEKKYEF